MSVFQSIFLFVHLYFFYLYFCSSSSSRRLYLSLSPPSLAPSQYASTSVISCFLKRIKPHVHYHQWRKNIMGGVPKDSCTMRSCEDKCNLGGLFKHYRGLFKHYRGLLKHYRVLFKHYRGFFRHYRGLFKHYRITDFSSLLEID